MHGRRVHRLLAVGRLPRRRRPHQGRPHEDQQLDPPRPQHDAAGLEDHGQLRELQPGQGRGAQGRLRRGAPAEPAGVRGRVHRREHLRGPPRPAHHPAAVGRRARGHHAGHRDPAGQGHGLRGRLRRAHPQRPLRRRGDVRGRHRRRGERRQLGRRPRDPRPRPHDARHRRGVRAPRPRPGRQVQGLGRAVLSDRASTPVERSRSSTRRCATARSSRASRSPSRTSSRWPSSSTGSASPGSRAATRRPTRRTRSSSGAPSAELQPGDRHAGGLRLHPAAGRQGRRRPHAARRSSTPARPRPASSARAGTSTCSTPSAPPSTRAWRWWARAWRS